MLKLLESFSQLFVHPPPQLDRSILTAKYYHCLVSADQREDFTFTFELLHHLPCCHLPDTAGHIITGCCHELTAVVKLDLVNLVSVAFQFFRLAAPSPAALPPLQPAIPTFSPVKACD